MKRQLSSCYLILFTVFSFCYVNNQSYGISQWFKENKDKELPPKYGILLLSFIVFVALISIPFTISELNLEAANKKKERDKEIKLMAEKLNAANRLHLVSPRPVIVNELNVK